MSKRKTPEVENHAKRVKNPPVVEYLNVTKDAWELVQFTVSPEPASYRKQFFLNDRAFDLQIECSENTCRFRLHTGVDLQYITGIAEKNDGFSAENVRYFKDDEIAFYGGKTHYFFALYKPYTGIANPRCQSEMPGIVRIRNLRPDNFEYIVGCSELINYSEHFEKFTEGSHNTDLSIKLDSCAEGVAMFCNHATRPDLSKLHGLKEIPDVVAIIELLHACMDFTAVSCMDHYLAYLIDITNEGHPWEPHLPTVVRFDQLTKTFSALKKKYYEDELVGVAERWFPNELRYRFYERMLQAD